VVEVNGQHVIDLNMWFQHRLRSLELEANKEYEVSRRRPGGVQLQSGLPGLNDIPF
jgi:hypothetical protein